MCPPYPVSAEIHTLRLSSYAGFIIQFQSQPGCKEVIHAFQDFPQPFLICVHYDYIIHVSDVIFAMQFLLCIMVSFIEIQICKHL